MIPRCARYSRWPSDSASGPFGLSVVANHDGRQRSQCHTMGTERSQTELQSKYEPFAPLAGRHLRCLLREGLRQFVVQGEDDRPLVGEVTIQERGTHADPGRDIAQRSRFIATLANQGDSRLVELEARRLAAGRSARRPASFPWFANFSEHVYY
jgi:hypothetical protein